MPNPTTITVKDASGTDQTVSTLDAVLLSNDTLIARLDSLLTAQAALLVALNKILKPMQGESEYVAANATTQVLGATGATGDYLAHILIFPVTTTPGVVTLFDGSNAIPIFPGGAGSVSNLVPIVTVVNAYSSSGPWKLTTGANVSALAVGDFT